MLPSKVAIPMPILFAEPSKPMEMSFFSILGFQRDRERERAGGEGRRDEGFSI